MPASIFSVPSSTVKGQAVVNFPQVCVTPGPTGPVPIPYPNVAMIPQPSAPRSTTKVVAPGSATDVSSGANDAGTLRSLVNSLNTLHGQLIVMPGVNPTVWHQTLDAYVMTAAELYRHRASR
jgi:hypothetical protein